MVKAVNLEERFVREARGVFGNNYDMGRYLYKLNKFGGWPPQSRR